MFTTAPETFEKKQTGTFSLVVALISFLLVVTTLSLVSGYLAGQYFSNSKNKNSSKTATTSATLKGKKQFTDSDNGYSFSYPDSWQASKRAAGIPGANISFDKTSVEFWIGVDQPAALSTEQKAALVATNHPTLKIGTQNATTTEYIYTAGNYFSVIKMPAQNNNPLVCFWIRAENQASYNQAKEIVQSFSF